MASRTSGERGLNRSETAASAALRRLGAQLAADPEWIPAVSREIAEAVLREFPELREDAELRATTGTGAESNVRQLIEILRAGAEPSEAPPPPTAIEHAYAFVRRGVPVDLLLRAYQVGQATFIHALSAAVRETIDDPDEVAEALEEVAATTLTYINAVIGDLIKRYAQERDRWVRSAVAVRDQTVRALLAGQSTDLGAAEQRLGYSLRRAHLGFVVWSPPQNESIEDIGALERAAGEFAVKLGGSGRLLVPFGAQLIAGWIGGYDEVVPRALPRIDVDAAPQARGAIGSPGSGVDGFARTHREAMQAHRVAELAGRRPGSVVAYGDVALTALASADLDHARDFVLRELGPLAADDDDTLRLAGTLSVYLEERSSPRRTAERLGVHPNTVANRIRAAQELLGEPIEDRVSELLVALRLAAVVRGKAPAGGAQAG
jgi:DNA-binding PucR family transcriptional regulator